MVRTAVLLKVLVRLDGQPIGTLGTKTAWRREKYDRLVLVEYVPIHNV